MYRKRNLSYILLIIISGAAIGTALSILIGFIVPEGVVKDFFLTSKPLGWEPFTMNLQIFTVTTGFTIDISIVSILGMLVAWYFLRYFK